MNEKDWKDDETDLGTGPGCPVGFRNALRIRNVVYVLTATTVLMLAGIGWTMLAVDHASAEAAESNRQVSIMREASARTETAVQSIIPRLDRMEDKIDRLCIRGQ